MSFDREALAAAVAARGRVARVVVAAVHGSAPREAGAAMLVWAAGAGWGQAGTVGGGALEWEAAREARALLEAGADGPLPAPRRARIPLGPARGQCCGGAVTLVTEVWDAAVLGALPAGPLVARRIDGPEAPPFAVRRLLARARGEGALPAPGLVEGWMVEPLARPARLLWIWGAGHVGRAIVAVTAPLPGFALTWIDTAAERFPPEIPAGVARRAAADPVALVADAPAGAEHLVVTFSHALDLALCHALLGHGFRFLGLIGSATKRARFRARLAALGHAPAAIDRIACPIGDPALGKHPQAIAVGVAAELLRAPAAAARPREASA